MESGIEKKNEPLLYTLIHIKFEGSRNERFIPGILSSELTNLLTTWA